MSCQSCAVPRKCLLLLQAGSIASQRKISARSASCTCNYGALTLVILQDGNNEVCLAALHHAKCLLLLVLPPESALSGAQLDALGQALQPPLKRMAAAASEHFAAQRQGHISGLR